MQYILTENVSVLTGITELLQLQCVRICRPAGITLWKACLFLKAKTGMKVTHSILVSPLFQQASYIIFVLQKIEKK